MTSIRDLAKKTKKSISEQTDRVLDAEIEETSGNLIRFLKSQKKFWRLLLSSVPLFWGLLFFGNCISDIGSLYNGEIPTFSGLGKHHLRTEVLVFSLITAGSTFLSKMLRQRLKLETSSFRLIVWCERLTYFYAAVMLFDYYTLGISVLLAGFYG